MQAEPAKIVFEMPRCRHDQVLVAGILGDGRALEGGP